MGLTYDGITYRSLEEQVRYDAEQVQLLKQADITINENLQTINTEINGKLTKPTTPTAESAVTMLADGTVGTKPLSEIGGGGKLYKHDVTMGHVALGTLAFESISCINVSFVDNNFANFPNFVVFLNDIRPTFNGKTVKKITKYEEHGSYGRGIMISYSDSTSEYLEFVTFVNQPIIDNVKAE